MSLRVLILLLLLLVLASLLVVFRQRIWQAVEPHVEPLAERMGIGDVLTRDATRGLVVAVRSSPSGARLLVDGEDRGQTPLVTNAPCRDGDTVKLALEKPGFATWSRVVDCGEEETVSFDVDLERGE